MARALVKSSPHDCLFCRIVAKEVPADIVYEDEQIVAFRDIQPKAPVHLLVVPRRHVASPNELRAEHAELVGLIHLVCGQLARENGVAETGYRVVANCQSDAGQTVSHIHFHLLGGRRLGRFA
ncbi:MAG: histidine triad nucleotide-binding protein [Firmicutes bacterium]|nr:histidine triad nucleotide-binding protein [Bacillota bacterium]